MMPFTDDFVTSEDAGREFIFDIEMFICEHCLTAQTQHNVDVGDYYEDYQYSVGASGMASVFMNLLAKNLKDKYYPLASNVKVLEIGSGDGEQLLAFKETDCVVLGYEPSSTLCEIAEKKGIPSIQGLFDEKSITELPDDFKKLDVIMLSYTFDHLPKPREFLETCHRLLDSKKGLLVIEVHDLEKIIERQEYCLFEHEHSVYLTEATAHALIEKEGFTVIDFDLVPEVARRANSLIIVATPQNSELAHLAVQPRTPEIFKSLEFYETIEKNIASGISNLETFIANTALAGQRLAGYGAGGRGVMTLAAVSNSKIMTFLVDRKPKKAGLLAPKSHIPVVDIDHLRAHPVDVVLVFSFGYMAEIQDELSKLGYATEQFHSLLSILSGKS
jgi:ubiquinone/menaquinone biosynthesis C-methylase UbiE